MCGRYTLTAPPETIAEVFGLEEAPDLEPRFNIAPGQEVATIHRTEEGRRVLALRRWGLVPSWAGDPGIGARLINARSETAADKPAFREALRRRRCLVPADGFYEWGAPGPAPRQPYHVARADRGLLAFAGLFERWHTPADAWLETCTILTTAANARLAPLHDRMPVILPPEAWLPWLDPELRDPERLRGLLLPAPDDALEARAVGTRVNAPEHDDPECLEPPAQGTLF